MATSRRMMPNVPRMTRRPWEDVARDLEEYLKKMRESWADGIPPGYNAILPETVEAGSSGAYGAELDGWTPASHEHPVITGAPSALANATAEGTATALPRLDHQHKRDVRVKEDGADVGTRNALNFVNNDFVTWGTTDDPGNDEVDLEGTLGPSLEIFTGTGTILGPNAAVNVIVWEAPFACDVTNVRGYRVGGTGATINARKNGTSTHLSSDLSLTSVDTWMDGGSVQNVSYATSDKLELMLITIPAPKAAQIAIQIYFNRT